MPEKKAPRTDKYLWSVRLFKTRSNASEACSKGKVYINDKQVKASRAILEGDVIKIRKNQVLLSYLVKDIPKSRVSAKLVPEYIENMTPGEELQKLVDAETFFIKRDKGSGRPTKKERRLINKLGDF